MLRADEIDAECRRVAHQVELLTIIHVALHNHTQSKALAQQYERTVLRLRGLPEPEDRTRPSDDPDDPARIAMEIRADPYIGGIISQVTQQARLRQLEEQGQSRGVREMDPQMAMAKARRERDELLRTVRGQGSGPGLQPPAPPAARVYSARRRGR